MVAEDVTGALRAGEAEELVRLPSTRSTACTRLARRYTRAVPYRDLSELEKDVDRAMVEGTLRVILHLGFSISRC